MATSVSHDAMANAIRFLALDAVEKAKSGHPGLPMGSADVATVLWRDVLKFDASDPHWPDRDRFVLSAGHGCMLLYSLLYLTGVGGAKGLGLDDIKQFRQVGSRTPGTPNIGARLASRRRPVRSARGLRPRSAWRSPSACSPRAFPASSTITRTSSPPMAILWKA